MTFALTPASPFVTGSQLPPETANYWRAAIASMIDPVNGSSHTPLAPIIIGGAQGLRVASGGFLTVLAGGTLSVASTGTISFTSGGTITGTLTLSAATTASDLTMSGTNKVKLASRSITRAQASMPSATSATWTIDAQGFAVQAANNTDKLIWPLRVPHGATLTAVSVGIDGAGGHGGNPTRPSVEIGWIGTTGFNSLGSATDATSIPSYDSFHSFGVSGLSEVVDRTNRRYVAIITGETGGNYVAGLKVHYVDCTYTITAYDED
ncbi:hypothetical protein WMF38_57390 [Sorangium sp. So ce118]